MAPIKRTTAFDLAAALVTAWLCLPTTASGGVTGIAQAQAERATMVQSVSFEAEHRLRTVEHQYGEEHQTLETLEVTHRIPLNRFNLGLGTLERVRITLQVHVEHDFSGSLGDGLPLNETGEPVAIASGMETVLEVLGPDGRPIAVRTVASDAVGCAGMRACAFDHFSRVPITLQLDPSALAAFTQARPSLTLRLATTGPVLPMLCHAEGMWDRCRLEEARIGLSTAEDGAVIAYDYQPAPRTAPVEGSTLPSAISRTGAILLLGVSSLLGLFVLLRRRRYP
ncbi:MAG: hypothetical protein AAGE90_02405 [Pseudomonadota bacterium]